MKQDFDRADRLEKFRRAINYEAKLYCNVDEAFSIEKAADFLQQLTRSWRMNDNEVIAATTQRVRGTIDKQLREYVLQFADEMKIPFDEAEIKQRWDTLTDEEKSEIADGMLAYMQEHEKSRINYHVARPGG